jgi:DNA replication protein DnaC
MSDINPHGFPSIRDMLSRTYRQLHDTAMASWRRMYADAEHASAFLADWHEAIADDEAREVALAAARETERAKAERARLLAEDIPKAFLAAGAAPRDVRMWRRGGYAETESLKAVRELLAAPGERPFLVLAGAVGSGKTCGTALALLEHASGKVRWRERDTPRFWNAAAVALGALLGKAGEEVLEEAIRAPVLVLEDLGAESMVGADVWLSMLNVVLDERYRAEAVTIITTNLDMAVLRKRYGERMADRLRQCARLKGTEAHSMRRTP